MSKRIRLSEAAYERLAARKRADETFSDAVIRLTDDRPLLELTGLLADDDVEDLRTAIDERRERRHADLEAIAEDVRGG